MINHQLDDDMSLSSDLVISGISTRLPESSNIMEFNDNLMKGIDMVTESRWTSGLYGLPERNGRLQGLDKFDYSFFGISAAAAHSMDPMFRLLLEVTWEALFDAGINPKTLKGSKTGVFIGSGKSEAWEMGTLDPDIINEHTAAGCSIGMLANGLSGFFDLQGPSFTVDTACSSSLLAMERAVDSIKTGKCEAAIVGGANILLKPQNSLAFHRLNMLSKDGTCKAFDDSGNGYVRSEAVVAILIQKRSVAKRSYAKIINAKTNCDGYKEQGITYPSGNMQKRLLEEVYAEVSINPSSVVYVEAHGTGTQAGDTQEVNSLAEFFCNGRDPLTPLLLGSVKSNMGHAETASGLCSLAKCIISIKNGIIPGNLHYRTPNQDISALHDGRLKVVNSNMRWKNGVIGINSFGFGGANVHVILEPENILEAPREASSLPVYLPVSGRTEIGVRNALHTLHTACNGLEEHNASHVETAALLQNISKETIDGHMYRGFSVLKSGNEQIQVDKAPDILPQIWFILSGMGSQWTGMGRDLLEFEQFRISFDKCAKILKPLNFDLYDVILSEDESKLESTTTAFVAIVSIQIAMLDVLRSIGIVPDGLIGHSIGEIACGYADGSSSREATLLMPYKTGKCFDEFKEAPGGMAAVGLSWEDVKLRCPDDIFPACNNAKDSISVAGPIESIQKFVQILKSEGIFAREIKTGHAFHSPHIAEITEKINQKFNNDALKNPKARTSRWISSSIPEALWNSDLAKFSNTAYYSNNLRSPVLFQEALTHVPESAIVIEIGPHALLQTILKRSLPGRNVLGLSMRNSTANQINFLSAIGNIYAAGHNPNISKLFQKVRFPISKNASFLSPLVSWDHSESFNVANFEQNARENSNTVTVSLNQYPFLQHHLIDGKIQFPATGYLYLVWDFLAKNNGVTIEDLPVEFSSVQFCQTAVLRDELEIIFSIGMLTSGAFEIYQGQDRMVSGYVCAIDNPIPNDELELNRSQLKPRSLTLNSSEVYNILKIRGYEYGGVFQGIQAMDINGTGLLAWNDNWIGYLDSIFQFQTVNNALSGLYLPNYLESVKLDPLHLRQFIAESLEPEILTSLPVRHFKNQNIIRSPGVLIKGLTYSYTPQSESRHLHLLNQLRSYTTDENVKQYFTSENQNVMVKPCSKTEALKIEDKQVNVKYFEKSRASLESCNVYYFVVNPLWISGSGSDYSMITDPTLNSILEYAGIDSKGMRVMGLVSCSRPETSVLPDPDFLWEVPQGWTLEDAATVPLAYATAYYALIIRGELQPAESILIDSSKHGTSQAAISIALSMNCQVFVAVDSKEEKSSWKSKFSELQNLYLIDSSTTNVEMNILEITEGRGVNLVLSSASAVSVESLIRCLAMHGRFLNIETERRCRNTTIGMAAFLENISFHGIQPDSLLRTDFSDKKAVFLAVNNGIKLGVVKPLNRTICNINKTAEEFHVGAATKALIKIREEHSIRGDLVASPFNLDYLCPDKGCIFVGDLEDPLLEYAEFLVRQGVKHVIILGSTSSYSEYQQYFINSWRAQSAQIDLITLSCSSLSDAGRFLQNMNKIGNDDGILSLVMNQTEAERFLNQFKTSTTDTLEYLEAEIEYSLIRQHRDYIVVFNDSGSI